MSQNDCKATAHAVFLVMGYNALLNSAVVSSWSKRRDFLICSYFSALSQSSNKFKLNVDYGSMNQNMFLVKPEMWVCYTRFHFADIFHGDVSFQDTGDQKAKVISNILDTIESSE